MFKFLISKVYAFALVFLIFFMFFSNVFATKTFEPVFNPSLSTMKTMNSIDIDGTIEENEWQISGKINSFVERNPGENVQPDVETEVYITYDNDHLYVAFRCFDDPSSIRATMCERDQFYSDDAVVVLIDTYGTAAWAYEFFVNPYGVQKDQLWSSVSGEDSGFDLIWKSAARVTEFGYEVEMAIPFASMRFPKADIQNWKIDFWRNRPRESFKQYSWAANDRDEQCFACKFGTVEGIKEISPGKGFEFMPTFISNQYANLRDGNDPNSDFDEHHMKRELSLSGKYSVSSNSTFEATYNPDFSQIEADATQIDINTTISLFYPERRPYFQEGRDIFRTLFNSFYTRTVNDPQYSVKYVSRQEKIRIGFLSAYDENSPYTIPLEESTIMLNNGKSYVNVLRGTQNIGGSNEIGFLVSDRRYENGGSGSILAFDHSISFKQKYTFVGQYILSHTKESHDLGKTSFLDGTNYYHDKYTLGFDGESYFGNAFITSLRRGDRNTFFSITVDQVSPTYRTQTGFDPVNNDRNLSLNGSYTFQPQSGIFERISPNFNTYNRWNFDGTKKMEYINFNLGSNLRYAQTFLGIHGSVGKEMFNNVMFDNLSSIGFDCFSRFSDKFSMSFGYNYSNEFARFAMVKDKANSISLNMSIKPIDRLIIEPNWHYVKAVHHVSGERLYEGYTTRTRIRLQATPKMSLRMVVQYNDFSNTWDFDPMFTYRISPFSVFYMGTTYDYRELINPDDESNTWKVTDRQFFMKIQYLFQT